MLLSEVVAVSHAVRATRSRSAKTALLAEALRSAVLVEPGQSPDRQVQTVAGYLSGVLPQGRIGIGWKGLTAVVPPADRPTLTVLQVDVVLERIAAATGPGSARTRTALLAELLAAATEPEQRFLRRLLGGELRQGALDGTMLPAVALAAQVPEPLVRRAVMLAGHAGPVAAAALGGGSARLAEIGLQVGRAVRPMLAASAPDLATALAMTAGVPGRAEPEPAAPRVVAVDGKLDGIRVQVHKDGATVRVFTRSLDEVSDRLPEVTELTGGLPVRSAVLDGEAIALLPDGRPHPFQVTGARTASSLDPQGQRLRTPLTTYFFDLLHLDGEDLLDLPAAARMNRLAGVVPPAALVPRVVTNRLEAVQEFFDSQLRAGHEGVVVKDLDAPYAAGRRGAGWVKVKPRHTLDLVVLAVEWGSGRRVGLLSNIHLGARDPATGGFVMLGKTFKGMTDEVLRWQTERFLQLETGRAGHVVQVRPEQVVEIAFDGLQRSSRYPGGLALRFARVVRYRHDKTAAEADTVETVRELGGG